MKRVFLFDVDGTLLVSGGAGARALERACRALHGEPATAEGIRFHGRTDHAICREMLRACTGAAHVADRDIQALLEAYLPLLEEEVAHSPGYRVLDGVDALLRALSARGEALGLATGNIERGARIKIARGGLDAFFPFGGLGDDGEDRADLVTAACARARARFAPAGEELRIYVVGDTELDVKGAHQAGCQAIAVASGWEPIEALRAAEPEYLFSSLEGAHLAPPFA
jgi:phosphoglycolate phosphatase